MAYFVGLVDYDLINILQPSTFVKSFKRTIVYLNNS